MARVYKTKIRRTCYACGSTIRVGRRCRRQELRDLDDRSISHEYFHPECWAKAIALHDDAIANGAEMDEFCIKWDSFVRP